MVKKNVPKKKEDVQVFTSLPPNVEGDIKFFLILEISKVDFYDQTPLPLKQSSSQINRSNVKTKIQTDATVRDENFIVRCVWWGEENIRYSIFRPKIVGAKNQNERAIQTTAKYMVRSGKKQFSAYLNG